MLDWLIIISGIACTYHFKMESVHLFASSSWMENPRTPISFLSQFKRNTLEVLEGFTRPPFVVVIPTYGRPDRLVRETLGFLKRQKIPQNLIEILGP